MKVLKAKQLKEFLKNVSDDAEILIDYGQSYKVDDAQGTIIDCKLVHPEYVILIHDNEPKVDFLDIF